MRQDNTESFQIRLVVYVGALDQTRQLVIGVPQSCIFEVQPGCEILRPGLGINGHSGGIEIKTDDPAKRSRLMPVVVSATRRNESELFPEVPQRGPRQALDEGFTVETHALIADREQMERTMEAVLEFFAAGRLDDLCRHAVPSDGATLNDIRRRNLHHRVDEGRSAVKRAGVVIGWVGAPIAETAVPFYRQHHAPLCR